jgi:hypothetical protein
MWLIKECVVVVVVNTYTLAMSVCGTLLHWILTDHNQMPGDITGLSDAVRQNVTRQQEKTTHTIQSHRCTNDIHITDASN